jgi:hypothetical protein
MLQIPLNMCPANVVVQNAFKQVIMIIDAKYIRVMIVIIPFVLSAYATVMYV